MIRLSLSILFAFVSVSCSQNKSTLLSNKRDRSFYDPLLNPASEMSQAEAKMGQLKILETGEEYPIRIALFNNNQFYYQVDKLGTGYGDWHYQEGALVLEAKRLVFDVEFWVSAARPEGNETIVRFIDRHGLNSHALGWRDPAEMARKNQAVKELRPFTNSPKDI